ncbi:uncharacterized protein [Rutidosis leptorrhynchoides]|uniref:uncharacterized protein n=1 Tax=Rutidosis leptorrhynchoides TaxID=125765 RepID=UPI003A99F4AB
MGCKEKKAKKVKPIKVKGDKKNSTSDNVGYSSSVSDINKIRKTSSRGTTKISYCSDCYLIAMTNCRASSRIMRFQNRFRCETNCGRGNAFNCRTCGKRGNRKGKRSKVDKTPLKKSSEGKPKSLNSEEILSLSVQGFAVDVKFGWRQSAKRFLIRGFIPNGGIQIVGIVKRWVGKSGGLLVVWDKGAFEVDSHTFCEFFLAIRGRWRITSKESTILNVYGPHNDRSKQIMWEYLDKIMESIISKWLLCGDFNEVRSFSDRMNSQFHQCRADRFNDFIVRDSLIKIPINGKKFTRISDDGVKFSKLDWFLVSDDFLSLWEDLSIVSLERNLSDHCPLVLRDMVLDYGPRPFKVSDEWFNCVEVDKIIRQAWNQPIKGNRKECAFMDRLKNVKMALKSWSFKSFGSLDSKINELKKEAMEWELKAESNTLSDSDRATWLDCRRRWVEKEKVKTNMLKQKAKVKWILDGDENSKFFHASLRWKYNKCNFRGIMVDGIWHEDPFFVKDTISLIGSFYKVIAKLLSLRLRKVISNLVGFEQSAFIKGRNIMDGVLIANESYEFLKRIRIKSMLFKVDFEKAFDSLSWEFLDDMMGFMGFGVKWGGWISSCLKTASISVLVNGSPTKEFRLGRGVRQGDPLSPFLFIIVAEGLNWLEKSAVSNSLYCGVKIGSNNVPISHLQYADDTLFFGEWSLNNVGLNNVESLMKLLKCFELCSGLKVNYNKSNLFGVGVDKLEVESMANLFGCKVGNFPFIYLGLPIGAKMNKYESWKPVIDKFGKRLADWKARSMSFGGRATLVTSVLNSLPLYYFLLFRAPPCVLKNLESVRRKFFWGGSGDESKISWVKWDDVIRSYADG